MTHSDVGSCHRDSGTSKVSYSHAGLGTPERVLIIEDVVAKIEEFREAINGFLGQVFLYSRGPEGRGDRAVLGIFLGRFYQRTVRPASGGLPRW